MARSSTVFSAGVDDFGVTMGAIAVFGFFGQRFHHRYAYLQESRLTELVCGSREKRQCVCGWHDVARCLKEQASTSTERGKHLKTWTLVGHLCCALLSWFLHERFSLWRKTSPFQAQTHPMRSSTPWCATPGLKSTWTEAHTIRA